MTALAIPSLERYDSWAACVAEFGDDYPHGSGIAPEPPYSTTRAACAALVERARLFRTPGAELPDGRLPSDYRWIAAGDEVAGFLRFTWTLNDWLREEGGHIGYSVRPSRRRRGHAYRALGLACGLARDRGLGRVLVTCDDDNAPSARTIESQGGLLEDIRHGKRRYWITL